MTRPADSPDLPFPPILLPVAVLLAAALLEWLVPLGLLPPAGLASVWSWAGVALTLAGYAFAAWAVATFRRAGTNVQPWKPTLKIVEHGPYRLGRNPIYLAMVVMLAGLALVLGLDWAILALPFVWLAFDRLIVTAEEAYLRDRFGAEYEAYLRRTRRWV